MARKMIGSDRYTTYYDDSEIDIPQNKVALALIEQDMQDRVRKQNMADNLKAAIAEGIFSGKVKPKAGADLNNMDYGNMSSVLGSVEPRNADLEMLKAIRGGDQTGDASGLLGKAGGGGYRPKSLSVGPYSFEYQPTDEEIKKDLERETAKKMAEAEAKNQVPTSQQKQDLQKAKFQFKNLETMESKANKIPAGYAGIGTNVLNWISRSEASPDTALYNKELPTMAVAVYRDLSGDTRLSDADAKARAMPLLWNNTEGGAIRKKSFDDLKKLYQARISLIETGMYRQGKDGEFITPLEDVMAEAKNISGDKFTGQGNQGKFTGGNVTEQRKGKTKSGIGFVIE